MLNVIYAECHYAECHNAECHNAECHYAECQYAECHYDECHYAECHGTGGSAVVEQQTRDPMTEGSNAAAAGTRALCFKKIYGNNLQIFVIS